MTHDKLLARIDADWVSIKGGVRSYNPTNRALRAVVELHKPIKGTYASFCSVCDSHYPCLTIQAIEEQIK